MQVLTLLEHPPRNERVKLTVRGDRHKNRQRAARRPDDPRQPPAPARARSKSGGSEIVNPRGGRSPLSSQPRERLLLSSTSVNISSMLISRTATSRSSPSPRRIAHLDHIARLGLSAWPPAPRSSSDRSVSPTAMITSPACNPASAAPLPGNHVREIVAGPFVSSVNPTPRNPFCGTGP